MTERGWPENLTELPGVGPYTAAAVGSFAWDRQHVAVDTNVRRVLERFDGVQRSPTALARRAHELLPAGRAAAFNQAMMELGATVCTPRRARCDACPVHVGCAARGAIGVDAARVTPRVRFQDTDRWARGRVVAALLAGEPLPPEIVGERRDRVLSGLQRDGLIALGPDGAPRLPA